MENLIKKDNKRFEQLKTHIRLTIEDNLNNKKLLKDLRTEFINKGMNENLPNLLWSDNIDEDHIGKKELIAITKTLWNELRDDKFELLKYFGEQEIFSYENTINIKDKKIDYVLFKEIKKLDNKNYQGVITGKQAVEMRKNSLYAYYFEFQRAPKLVKTASGRVIKKIDMNINNVLDMEKEFTNGTMTPTSIHFAVLKKSKLGLKENFKFVKPYAGLETIGDMQIIPNFNIQSDSYFPLMSVDGYHRFTAMCNAVELAELEGRELDCKLGCYIHVFDNESDIKKFILDTFKRCDTDMDYLNAIEPSDEKDFINKFIDGCKWLSGHVALTKQELKIDSNYVEQKTLIEAFKNTDVEINDSVDSEIAIETIAKIIDDVLDYTIGKLYNNDLLIFRNSIYLDNNIFKLYVSFAAKVRDEKYRVMIPNFVNFINEYSDEIHNTINNKSIKLEDYFNELTEKVIKNEF